MARKRSWTKEDKQKFEKLKTLLKEIYCDECPERDACAVGWERVSCPIRKVVRNG